VDARAKRWHDGAKGRWIASSLALVAMTRGKHALALDTIWRAAQGATVLMRGCRLASPLS